MFGEKVVEAGMDSLQFPEFLNCSNLTPSNNLGEIGVTRIIVFRFPGGLLGLNKRRDVVHPHVLCPSLCFSNQTYFFLACVPKSPKT